VRPLRNASIFGSVRQERGSATRGRTRMLDYGSIEKHYLRKGAPSGFFPFMNANDVAEDAVNTCGIRLAYAIFKAEPLFFKDKAAPSKVEWYGLPTRADDLALILSKYIVKPARVTKMSIKNKTGVVFFDTIKDFSGTGHISLWDGKAVLDKGDYFHKSPRVYFFDL
jgi:Type VI secretion system (T6SS), amidase effector protein 4